jgi:SSS family solute:Na+ symporter
MMLFLAENPDFRASLPPEQYDYLIPLFIVSYLPHGIVGFILVGIFAAAMSSIDSAINSLSAATLKDVLLRTQTLKGIISKRFIFYSRLTTLAWGVLCTAFAYLVGTVSATVIEGINKIGSVFYGPLLACFALGIVTRSARSGGVIVGLFSGICLNLTLWALCPAVSWLWWNLTGCACTFGVGMLFSRLTGRDARVLNGLTFDFSSGWMKKLQPARHGGWAYPVLLFYFLLIVSVSWGINQLQ